MGAVAELPIPETGAVAELPIPDTGESVSPEEADAQAFRATRGGFERGLRSGVVNIGTAANNLLGQAAEFGADITGGAVSEGLTEFAKTRFEQAKHMAEFADSVAPDTRDLQGVKDFSTALDYVGGQMGQALGSTGPALAAGLVLRRPVAGVFAATLPQEAGGQVQTLRADPEVMARTTAGERLAGSLGVGAANAAIETLGGPTRVVKNVLNPRMAKGVVKEILKTGGEQGLQEAAQQVVQQQGHRVLNPERDASGDVMDVINAGVGGTIGGLGLGAGGQAVTAPIRAIKMPDTEVIANLFKRKEGEAVDPESLDYPDHLQTPEEVADYLDSTKERGMKFLNDTWERVKEHPWAQQFKEWKEDPAIAGEFFKEAKQKAMESEFGGRIRTLIEGGAKWVERNKAEPKKGEKLSLVPTKMDDNILDAAMENIPPEFEAVMTPEQKLKLVDILKTAARTGEVPTELYHLYGKDEKAAQKALDGTAKLLGVEPGKMKHALEAKRKRVTLIDDDVEELVRKNLLPKFRTKRETRDLALQNAVPYFQRYAHMGTEESIPTTSRSEGAKLTPGQMSEEAKAEKAFAEGQRPVAIAKALFGEDVAEAFMEQLDRIREKTTSDSPYESAMAPKIDLEEIEEVQPAKEDAGLVPEETPEVPKFQNDKRLMQEFSTLEAADETIKELRKEYGKRDAQFRVVDGGPGRYYIVAHDTAADESGFDENTWSRLWNKKSQQQRKAGLENGTLSVRRYSKREADGSPRRKPKLDEQGNPLLDENGDPIPGEIDSPIESQPTSLHSLVNEMMARYGRDREYADDTSRIGDMLFRGISQIMSDKSVAPKPFANAKVEGNHISFPDNMLIGTFDNKQYRWRDVKHAVLTKGEAADQNEDLDVVGQFSGDTKGWYKTNMVGKNKKIYSRINRGSGHQGPESVTAGDNLAVDEQDRFAHARSLEDEVAPGSRKEVIPASQRVVKKTEGSPPSFDVVEGGKGKTATISGPSPEFAERMRPGPTIAEQRDIDKDTGKEKPARMVDELTREEIQPREKYTPAQLAKIKRRESLDLSDQITPEKITEIPESEKTSGIGKAAREEAAAREAVKAAEAAVVEERNKLLNIIAKNKPLAAEDPTTPSEQRALETMASTAGWGEKGQRMLREGANAPLENLNIARFGSNLAEERAFREVSQHQTEGDVVGRTEWLGAEWYQQMRKDLGEKGLSKREDIQAAVEKWKAGKKLNANEKRTIEWMREDYRTEGGTLLSRMKVDKRKKLDAATEKQVRDYVTKVLGPSAKTLFASMAEAGSFADLSGVETLTISTWAIDPQSVGYHEAAHALFARLAMHDAKSKAMIENVASSPVMMGKLRELLAKHPNALAQLKDTEERAAYMYQFWEAGLLKFGPKATTFMEKVRAFFKNIVSIISGSGQGPKDFEAVQKLFDAFHRGDFADKNLVAAVAHDINPAGWWSRVNATLGPIATGSRRMMLSSEGLIRSMNQPALNRVVDLFHPALGSQSKETGFMNKAEISTRYINKWTLATEGATEKDMAQATQILRGEAAINPSAKAKSVAKATRDLFDELKTYQKDVRIKDEHGIWQTPGWLPDYFPQVYDQEYIDAHPDAFLDLLRKHGVADPTQIMTKVLRDVDSTVPGEDDVNTLGVSYFNKALNKRVIVNIPPDELAPFLSKNLPHTVLTYISQAVRRQEYAKRFGNDGEVIREALIEAKKNGLTKEQEETFNTAVKAMEGTIRPDMDRDLRKIMGGIATYQNIRLLPMALFSNLPDAMGVWVRGGTVGDAAKTWIRGLKEVFYENRDGGYDMAAALGQISRSLDDMFMAQAQAGSQYLGPWKGINDKFFTWNGLEGLNRGNRIGATIAAEKFIIRHAQNPTEHSERYLAELNLTKNDVKVRNGHLDMNDPKIMDAMNRWVDGAIIRPNAAIRPPWFSDPMFMLVSQLKQFTYGFQKVILARVAHEAVNGNLHPMMGMASMVPIIIAADMAKVALTPNAADDDFRKNWGVLDWIWSGIQRIGTFGIGQTLLELKSGPNSAAYVAGPTTNQVMSFLQGDLQRNLLKAIPGANIVGIDLNPVPPE